MGTKVLFLTINMITKSCKTIIRTRTSQQPRLHTHSLVILAITIIPLVKARALGILPIAFIPVKPREGTGPCRIQGILTPQATQTSMMQEDILLQTSKCQLTLLILANKVAEVVLQSRGLLLQLRVIITTVIDYNIIKF